MMQTGIIVVQSIILHFSRPSWFFAKFHEQIGNHATDNQLLPAKAETPFALISCPPRSPLIRVHSVSSPMY
jgi:hypothetical protein